MFWFLKDLEYRLPCLDLLVTDFFPRNFSSLLSLLYLFKRYSGFEKRYPGLRKIICMSLISLIYCFLFFSLSVSVNDGSWEYFLWCLLIISISCSTLLLGRMIFPTRSFGCIFCLIIKSFSCCLVIVSGHLAIFGSFLIAALSFSAYSRRFSSPLTDYKLSSDSDILSIFRVSECVLWPL